LLLSGTLNNGQRARLDMLREFSTIHKTFILLHAGDHAELSQLAAFFATGEHPYPWASFTEPGLNDAITSIVIIIPERLYDDAATLVGRAQSSAEPNAASDQIIAERRYSPWEIEFLKRRVMCSRAT
jgi:hypothetical protein